MDSVRCGRDVTRPGKSAPLGSTLQATAPDVAASGRPRAVSRAGDREMIRVLATPIVAVAALAGVARADAPPISASAAPEAEADPAADRAADANLESTAKRRGFQFALAVGGAL